MKNVITTIAAAILAFCTGCGPTRTEVPSINRGVLSTNGESVGTLPDGREVRRWSVWDTAGYYAHTIYVVDGATTISDNYRVPVGKTTRPAVEATVIINGKAYVPKE